MSTHDQICAEIVDINKTRDENDLLSLPSYWAVREAIRRIDKYNVVKARHGKQAAEARFAPVGKGEVARWPGEIAELDHTKMDLIVVDEETCLPLGRPWLVVLIDLFTRMPLGFHVSFDPPSVQTVSQCLKNAINPKSYVKKMYPDIKGDWPCFGVPGWVKLDRAMENVGSDIEDMASSVGFNVTLCPRKKAWYKGVVERFLGTLNRNVTNRVPGKTFASILERGDYNPAKDAIVTYDELLHLVHKWLIDDYMQSPHRGLGGVPIKVWEREVKNHEIPPLPDLKQLNASLGRVDARVLSRKGIEFENLFYMREDVVAWRQDTKFCELTETTNTGQRVKIKYDPTDMSKIWVLDPRTDRYVEVPCLDQDYTKSLSLWQHRIIKDYLRNQLQKDVNREGLLEARAEMQEMVDDMLRGRRGRRKTSTAAKGARFEGIGRNTPSGDDCPVPPSSSTRPHSPHPEDVDRSQGGRKPRNPQKPKSVNLLPPMSSDDIDLYADES
jgi:putative transposase